MFYVLTNRYFDTPLASSQNLADLCFFLFITPVTINSEYADFWNVEF